MKKHKALSAVTAAILLISSMPAVMANTEAVPQEPYTEKAQAVSTEEQIELAATLPYQDTSRSFEERAADLVARMTLEEKAAQTAAKSTPAISRLGVHSYYYWREGIHGVARQGGATSFPSSLAMSNTWDRELVFETMDITSTEARAKNNRYNLNYWNPTINLARDPRWGRNEESYGEDPYLTAEIGSQAVKGMQGTDEKYLKTITTLKHYAANNCEGERQRGTSIMNERTMREYYTRAFKDITEQADPGAVMTSYNGTTVYRNGEILTSADGQKIDYIASSANSYLNKDLLMRTFGFGGFIVGDCGAWDNAYGIASLRQKLYPDAPIENITAPMTVTKILESGSSLDCNSGGDGTAQVASAVQQGLISEDALDIAVYKLFLQRMKTGEFDDGAKYQDITSSVIEADEHVAKAEQAAEESWVLLENKNDTLPLKNNVSNIAVVGSLANEVVLGDYSADIDQMKSELVTPFEGITSEVKQINPNANIELVGNVDDSTPLFNIRKITLVKSGGKTTDLDLSSATNVIGMSKDGSTLANITKSGMAIIPGVDFKDVTDIQIEAASLPGMPNVTVEIGYDSASQNAANVQIANTSGADDYTINTAVYNGATGGYTETRNMYITIKANAEFSVENYKNALDKADYIIAYGGTTTADSSESNDRSSIDLPASQSHVQQICEAYPSKTIVVLQTVGQINVEGFKDNCAAMLWTSYNGQTQGKALGRVLTGVVNPSGKLTTTWYTQSDLEKMPIGSSRTTVDGIQYNFTNYELSNDINNPSADYPGRTYQYYTGTPVYPFGYGSSYSSFNYSNVNADKSNADANDIVTITADVTNTGSAAGTEVAQLYITVPGADGKTLPLKQLKDFKRVTLDAGETKTVTFSLDVSDTYFFNEETQKNYVIQGEYTAKVGGSSSDAENHTAKFNVSGAISETLKNVTAIPSGIKLYIANDKSGVHANEPANMINPGTSVALKNDALITDFAANDITITYTSSDPSVALVDNGMIKAGTAEGTATITVTASKNGSENVTTTFPVVTLTTERISDTAKAAYLKQLDDTYNTCPETAYTADNWQTLSSTYTAAKALLESELIDSNAKKILDESIKEITAVPRIPLTEGYTVQAVNPNIISDNRIEYSANGIGTYTAAETTVSGTVTKDNPAVIDMAAYNNENQITSPLIWTVEKLDSSSRTAPSIDMNTGKLTIYENGVFKVTASDYPNQKSGSITVYANLQIEGESADDADGASLTDVKAGASGGSSGNNAGSTSNHWLKFNGVKLDKLTGITFRVSKKSEESIINVSLMGNSDWIVASTTAQPTGSWTNWTEVTAGIDRNELSKLTLDENGCGTIFVQTNAANLDYMKLTYNTSDVDVMCRANGSINVSVPYESGVILAAAYENGAMTKHSMQTFTESGSYTLDGFSNGDNISVFTWNSLDKMQPLSSPVSITYQEPVTKELTVYNFSDSVFDSFYTAPEETLVTSGLGMDGYGGWSTGGGASYTYNGRTYTFTRGLRGGSGTGNARRVFFTPDNDGVVTAIFAASTTREMNIEQNGNKITLPGKGDNTPTIVQLNVKSGSPVYVYGGGSNKILYAVLFEANKSVEITTPAPATPTPTLAPTLAPLPDDIHTVKVEFENYTNHWSSSKKETGGTGTDVGNTADGNIFYFGERLMDGLIGIRLNSAQRDDAGNATAAFYAIDMTGVDVNTASQSDITRLLTSENELGKVTIQKANTWNNYNDHEILFNSNGTKGLFVKLNTDGRYAGNHDYMTLMYSTGSTAAVSSASDSEILTAENDSVTLSIAGDKITAINKYSGNTAEYSYNAENGQNVSFKKLINWNGMIAALICDNNSGKTDIITTALGSLWINASPDYFAESNVDTANGFTFNDIIAVNDQLYIGCSDGALITMTNCAKCTIAKKVCGFDIKSLEYSDNKIILSGDKASAEISLADVRQTNIKGEAAKTMAQNGALLVDVRSPEEFAEYSIDGSINVPIDAFGEWLQALPSDRTIIVYCSAGTRAAKAMETAAEYGFTNIYNLGSIDELK